MGRVYLVRHGQASFGAKDYDKLSEKGIKQGELLGQSYATSNAAFITGTMHRHIETANAFLSNQDNAKAVIRDANWNEFDYLDIIRALRPEYETHDILRQEISKADDPYKTFQNLYEQALTRWSSGKYDSDYKETRNAFRMRINQALNTVRNHIETSEVAYVFTSGGPISAIIQQSLDLSEDTTRLIERVIINTSVTTLSLKSNRPRLISMNNYTHLESKDKNYVTYR